MFTQYFALKPFISLCLASWLGVSYFGDARSSRDPANPGPKAGNPKIDKLKLPEGFRAEHLYSPVRSRPAPGFP